MDKLKQKLAVMKDNAFCFVHLIADYVRQAISGRHVLIPLERHLKECPRCAREKEAYENFLKNSNRPNGSGGIADQEETLDGLPGCAEFEKEFSRLALRQKRRRAIKPGQVWATPGFPDYLAYRYGLVDHELPYSLDPRPFLVYRYDPETGTAEGFPINLDYFEFASDFDLVIPAEKTRLGFDLMVEVWNPVSTGGEFLQDYWGSLPARIMRKIDALVLDLKHPGESVEISSLSAPRAAGSGLRRVRTLLKKGSDTSQNFLITKDIQHQFRMTEQHITRFMSAPFLEKQELDAYKKNAAAQKFLETMIVYSVIHLHRHKDFLPVAGDDEDHVLYLYNKKQLIFNKAFTLDLSVNEREEEYLVQLRIIDNDTGEESRGFVVDIMEWTGNFPASNEELKTAYLLFKKNNEKLTHFRLWEKGKRLAIPVGKNAVFVLYKAGSQDRVEFIPLLLSSE